MSSASVHTMPATDQDVDTEHAGKLTEADKAHIGRVSEFIVCVCAHISSVEILLYPEASLSGS